MPSPRRLLFALDAERAHGAAMAGLRAWGMAGTPFARSREDPVLATTVAGVGFANPVLLAAGLDKDARAVRGLAALGFGGVEVGTLTLRPQPGNPRPRLFRLVEDRAVINRMGFNNGGLAAALPRIVEGRRFTRVGVNVGANRDAVDRIADYVRAVEQVRSADYVAINISSPNTPGLRDLQHGAALRDLLAGCDEARRGPDARATPLFLKVAPDLDRTAIDGIARAAIDHRIDALIVSNTTVGRPAGLRSPHAAEAGGLSGAPLAATARARLREFRAATGSALPLVCAGGIDSAEEAYARVLAGASLVQLYSALVFGGPGLPQRIVAGLAALLRRDGFGSVAEAVGAA